MVIVPVKKKAMVNGQNSKPQSNPGYGRTWKVGFEGVDLGEGEEPYHNYLSLYFLPKILGDNLFLYERLLCYIFNIYSRLI